MIRERIECSHILLGNGYTSRIASFLLKQKGIHSLIIDESGNRPLFDLELAGNTISPIPIFPLKDSLLYHSLKLGPDFPQKNIKVNFSGSNNCKSDFFKFRNGSLADFVSHTTKELNLSMKQWGVNICSEPYSEVQNKINRHYLSSNKNFRIGFVDGHSLYYHFIKKQNPEIMNCKSIYKIDFYNHLVFTDNYIIHYKKLISTIPVNHLFLKCGFKDNFSLKYEGAYFFYFTHKSEFEQNNIIYDRNLNSDILRIFSPTDNTIVAQLPTYKKGNILYNIISQRIKKLIPELGELVFEKELYFSLSYPLESITDSKALDFIQTLKGNSILPYGRFGNWEYSDLHELAWDSIF